MSHDISEKQTQFSIYKIDLDLVKARFKPKKVKDRELYLSNLCDLIIDNVINLVRNRAHDGFYKIKMGKFEGVVFKTKHNPAWQGMMKDLMSRNELKEDKDAPHEDFLINTNVSYVLLYKYKECIYAMTGGYGSNYISKFVVKNYGLYLIPKIISKENPVVKRVLENNLTGNRTSINRANRYNTSILNEQDLSSIYKELNIQIDREVAELLGIEFDNESSGKKLNVVNKDSIFIRRSFSIDELKRVISRLNKIESREDKFALNYLVLAKKKDIKDSELTNALIDKFTKSEYENFILVGDDFEAYYFNANSYQVIKEDGTVFLHKNDPIEIKDLFNEFEKNGMNLTKNLLYRVIKKWTIQTMDNAGNISLYPIPIFNVLQGFIEYGSDYQPCYLINGSWYLFDAAYSTVLDNDYQSLYDSKLVEAESLIEKYGLKITAQNEKIYNKKFKNKSHIIYADTCLQDNVELADIIFYDENTVFLMHNKSTFSGIGARDLTNQILTASEYLQKRLSMERGQFLREYYKKICEKNNVDVHPSANEEQFIKLFDKKICFVAGFLDGYSKNTRSTYAKYLILELNRKLIDRGQMFIPIGIGR